MAKGTRNSTRNVMTTAEVQCWASGGVWVGNACVNFVKATYARGAGCDPGVTERIIQASLPGPLREARAKVLREAEASQNE
jgi:hypothetical protein